jgi:hypothetical protein
MSERDLPKIRFPWIAFLWQPIGHPMAILILNPIKFKKLYMIWMLENCLYQNSAVKNYV